MLWWRGFLQNVITVGMLVFTALTTFLAAISKSGMAPKQINEHVAGSGEIVEQVASQAWCKTTYIVLPSLNTVQIHRTIINPLKFNQDYQIKTISQLDQSQQLMFRYVL